MKFFKYVPLGFVHVWEKTGWVVTPILNDTHHGVYAACMTPGPDCKWDGENPRCPVLEATA